jgi:phage shock protein C
MSAFRLDRRNSRLMGVCAGLANWSGIDVTVIRVSTVVLTLILGFTPVLVYLLAGWIAN